MRTEKIVTILDELSLIEGAREIMFSSLCWSQAVAIINLSGKMENPELTPEKLQAIEANVEQRKEVLSWCSLEANKDFLPSWDQLTKMLGTPQKPPQNKVKDLAELMGISLTEARRAILKEAEKDSAIIAKFIEDKQEELQLVIKLGLEGQLHNDLYELKDNIILSMLNKIANKMGDKIDKTLERAVKCSYSRRISREIAAERLIYKNVEEKALDLIDEMDKEGAPPIEGAMGQTH